MRGNLFKPLARTKSWPQATRAEAYPRAAAAPAPDDGNWWLITLCDLTLLLLGFLVCWHALDKVKPPPARLATDSVAIVAPKTTPAAAAAAPSGAEDWQSLHRELSEFVGAAGLENAVEVEITPSGVMLSLRESIPFASARAEIREQAMPLLDKLAMTLLAQGSLTAAIGGHTDSVRIATQQFPSNWELSTARASRVARFLVEKGVHPKRLSVQGYADHRPRGDNSDALSRRANRRVEIHLSHEAAGKVASAESKPDHDTR